MDKNEKEKNLLYDWGMLNASYYNFPQIDKCMKSYFSCKDADSYLKEYTFDSLPELMNTLNMLYENNEIMLQILKAVGIASLKNKPFKIKREDASEGNKKDLEDKLPAFIYNF